MARKSLSYRLARRLELVGESAPPTGDDEQPQRNAPSPLGVFLPWLVRRGDRRRQRLASERSGTTELDTTLDQLSHEIRTQQTIELPADGAWHDACLDLKSGESVTVLAGGRLFLSRPLEVSVAPRASLWYRIGDDDIQRLTRDCEQARADGGGRVRLRAGIPGEFDTPQGETNPDNPAPQLSGTFSVRLIRWEHTPEQSLAEAARVAPDVFEPLRQQLHKPRSTPEGWQYFWRMGQAGIFYTNKEGTLCCETNGDIGILQYPTSLPLSAGLQLAWSWCVQSLPSVLSEHIQPTHDYLSIAVEFDNGLDLTYMWSAQLPENTIFQCPLPWWDQRETHWVLRNTESGLGRWYDEQRHVLDDYRCAIGGPVPERVVGVWLIANSVFQNGHGRCDYRGISLGDAETAVTIHP